MLIALGISISSSQSGTEQNLQNGDLSLFEHRLNEYIKKTYYLFFHTKLFQNFIKLLEKIITCLYHRSFRPQNTSRENITWKNPMQSVCPFIVWSNFRLRKPFIFYFVRYILRLILLPYGGLFS